MIPEHAELLGEKENPGEVLEILRKFHPGSLRKYVSRVRLEWMQTYGSSHNDGPIRRDIQRVLKVIKRAKHRWQRKRGEK